MSATPLAELCAADVAHEEHPGRVLVHAADWAIHAGQWWALGGDPGSGKSALLAAAAGLDPPVRGEARLFGESLATASDSQQTTWRRQIGYVFEGGGRLLGRLTVAENVALPLRYHEDLDAMESRDRVAELLEMTGLEALADELPARISPAMQQRAALARALTQPIRILFLDDPLRGLAPGDARWWLGFLRALRERRTAQGTPLALVTSGYELDPWRDDATHLAELRGGRLHVLGAGGGAVEPAPATEQP